MEMQFHNELTLEDEELSDAHASSIPQRSLFSAPMGPNFPMGPKGFVDRNRERERPLAPPASLFFKLISGLFFV